MRPRGPESEALAKALRAGPGTSRQLAQRACVGLEAARYALDNMVRSDRAKKCDSVRVPGVKRPVPVYAAVDIAPEAGDALAQAVGAWWLDSFAMEAASA